MDLRKTIRSTGIAWSSALALIALLGPASALADSGLYIGGGLGTATLKDNTGTSGGVDFDESDTAWKLFVGYNLDLIPVVKFAVEGGYRDLGKPDGSVAGVPVEYSAKGLDAALLAGIGIGPVDLFARAGAMQYDLDKKIGGATRSFDGTAPVYGIGAWLTFDKIGVRAEYEVIDIDELDSTEMMSISVFYKF